MCGTKISRWHGDRETKKRPLFTGGKGKKKEQGKSLWSGEGLKNTLSVQKKMERCMRMMRKCK